MRKVRLYITVGLLVALSGCSSLQSNFGSKHRDMNGMPPSQFGHPYSGLTSYAGSWCYFTSPNMEKTHVKYGVAPLLFGFLLVDLPLTIIADTVLLPFELFLGGNYARATIGEECKYSNLDLSENSE